MTKKTSTKTLIIFWAIAVPLLVLWFFVLQWKNNPKQLVNVAYNTSRVLPFGNQYDTGLELLHYFLQKDNKERIFLILLQNNMELRPGGGYIGSFAVIKVKNGDIIDTAVHDTANFDGRIPDSVSPPYPMTETMGITSWKLRDSNWMPDFPSNARLAEKFYYLGGGQEKYSGVFAVNATVLDEILNITGPIKLNGYPDVYESGTAIMTLENQVEQAYKKQDIKKGDRKVVMNHLLNEIKKRVSGFSFTQKIALINDVMYLFDNKDIQLSFKEKKYQKLVASVGWDGAIDQKWNNDYFMIVDANLAAYKTDHVMKRSIKYDVDFSGSVPQSILRINYVNTATEKDWKTNDYQTYVRVYTPLNTWFTDVEGCISEPKYGVKYGKRYVGCLVHVPLDTQKQVVLRYNLPLDLKNQYPYDLKIQKQSGVHDVMTSVRVKQAGSEEYKEYQFVLNKDQVLSHLSK